MIKAVFRYSLLLILGVALFYFCMPFGVACATVSEVGRDETRVLSLEDAINIALSANRGVRGVAFGVEGRRLSFTSANSTFETKVTPASEAGVNQDDENFRVGVSIGKKSKFGPSASLSPSVGKTGDDYTGQVALSLDVPLLRGFGKESNLDAVESSRLSVRNAERSLYLAKVSTIINTVSAVYEIVKQRKLVELYELQARRLKGHAEAAEIKEKVGLATPIDVYRAQIRLNDAKDSAATAREALRSARDRLKLILAFPLETAVHVSAPVEHGVVKLDFHRATQIAVDNRVELEQARDEIRDAKRKSRVAESNLSPQLDVVFDYERFSTADEFGSSTTLDEDRWSINLISTTDWARTSEKAAYRQSLINIKTAELSFQSKKDDITRETREQLDALAKAEERMEIQLEQIGQAEGKLALAKAKFNHGLADNFDIIEAETELQQARANLLSVRIDYITGTYELRAALGTLIGPEDKRWSREDQDK